MTNLNNFGKVCGRLTKDPVILNNKDGSRKALFTIAVQDNFKSKDGTRHTQFVQLETFIAANRTNNGALDYMHKGDLVAVGFSVRSNVYTDNASGKTVYNQVLLADNFALMEPKNVTDARQKNAPAQTTASAPAPAVENAPVPEAIEDFSADAPFDDDEVLPFSE